MGHFLRGEYWLQLVNFFFNKTLVYSLSIPSLKIIEFFLRLFSKVEIKLFFKFNLKTCHVPNRRTANIKSIKNISNDLILNKTIY